MLSITSNHHEVVTPGRLQGAEREQLTSVRVHIPCDSHRFAYLLTYVHFKLLMLAVDHRGGEAIGAWESTSKVRRWSASTLAMEDELEIVYLVENAQQFWSGKDLITAAIATSTLLHRA